MLKLRQGQFQENKTEVKVCKIQPSDHSTAFSKITVQLSSLNDW